MTKKLTSYLLSKPNGGFLTPDAEKNWIMAITVKEIEKHC